jgi:hypothetical protein
VVEFIIPSGLLSLVKIPCIVLYNLNDKDTTNIVSLQMNVGFNTYLILNYMASTIHLLEKFV